MPKEERPEFNFINEQIIRKPIYRRKWFQRTVASIGIAILFGGAAGVTFAVVRPWADAQFGKPNEPTQIVVLQEESETETETETETEAVVQTETETEKETESETEQELAKYQELYQGVADVADSVEDCVVSVNGYTTETEWFDEGSQVQNRASGLIYAIDNNNAYIVTSSQAAKNSGMIVVTFRDGKNAEASVRRRDSATGLAMLQVKMSDIGKETRKNLSAVSLRGEHHVTRSQPVIAVGSLQNNPGSVAFGMITSLDDTSTMDNEYSMITTDIMGNDQSSGLLLNLDGDIVGIISQKYRQGTGQSIVAAIPITDISYVLNAMIDNTEIPYAGITGKTLSEEESRILGIPQGVYISQVETESPAMYAGIQPSDVIIGLEKDDISTMQEYAAMLKNHKSGDNLMVRIKRKSKDGYTDAEVEVTLGAR